jgi:hypothetical protein
VSRAIYPAAAADSREAARTSLLSGMRLESAEQRALIAWFRFAHKQLGIPDERLLFAVPNGGWRRRAEAAILIGEGVRPGIPDLFLAVARGSAGGLFIEMKTDTGVVSASQKQAHKILQDQGYRVVVARGFQAAAAAITDYLRS